MTKQLIYSTKKEAQTNLDRIEAIAKPFLKNGTTNYTYIVKHPTKSLLAIRIDTETKFLNETNLQVITSDWLPKMDI